MEQQRTWRASYHGD